MKKESKEQKLKFYYIAKVKTFAIVRTRQRLIYTDSDATFTHVEAKQIEFLKKNYQFEIKHLPKQLNFNF